MPVIKIITRHVSGNMVMKEKNAGNGGEIHFGVDGDGPNVIFYGDTSGAKMTWDAASDSLVFAGGAGFSIGAATTGLSITGATTTAISVSGDCTTGLSFTNAISATNVISIAASASTAGINISGNCTTGIVIGAQTTGISITGATTTAISLSGDATTGISITSGMSATNVISIAASASTAGINISGDCTTGITIGAQTTAGITISGATADGVLISGACTDAIHISGANTGNAIHISGDQVVGILYDVDANATTGISIAVDDGITLTTGISFSRTGTTGVVTTAISIDTDGTTGISIGTGFTGATGIVIAGTTTNAIQVSGDCTTVLDITNGVSGTDIIAIAATASSSAINLTGDCTVGIKIAAQTTAGISITGATATAIDISGATTTAIAVSGDCTTAISLTAGISATNIIAIASTASTAGINISGNCTVGLTIAAQTTAGITLTGATPAGISLSGLTLTLDATRTNYALGFGSRVTEKDITMAAVANYNLDPVQFNMNVIGVAPTSSTINTIYSLITHDTVDMSTLRLKCADWNIVVGKDVQDVYVYQGELDFTANADVSGEATALGLTVNASAGTITGNIWGEIICMDGASMPATSAALFLSIRTNVGKGLYIEPTSGDTLADGIYFNVAGAVTDVMHIVGTGNTTNFLNFDAVGGLLSANTTAENWTHAIAVNITGVGTRYIKLSDA